MSQVVLRHINKDFKNGKKQILHVLDDINLTIDKGEFLSILGPSGCGKSTILNLIAGLETASSGELLVEGKTIKGPGQNRIVVFQESGLFPWLSVLDNVMYGLLLKKMSKEEAEAKAIEVLQMVHLGKFINSFPQQYLNILIFYFIYLRKLIPQIIN